MSSGVAHIKTRQQQSTMMLAVKPSTQRHNKNVTLDVHTLTQKHAINKLSNSSQIHMFRGTGVTGDRFPPAAQRGD
jgi:hypothetical protein